MLFSCRKGIHKTMSRQNKNPTSKYTSRCRCTNRTSVLSGIAELTDSLYLCSAVAIRSANLTNLGITCVVNAAAELPDTPLPNEDIVYVKVPVVDRINCDLVQHFDTVSDLIHEVSKVCNIIKFIYL